MPSFKLILYRILLWFSVNTGLRNDNPLTPSLDPLAVTRAVILSFIVSFLRLSQSFFSESYIMCEQKTLNTYAQRI